VISRIRGEIAALRAGRVEIATASGVTYELLVPMGVFGMIGTQGDPVELFTALVAREDSLELFGFAAARDRELFLRLQSASGVGPRLALSILGTLPANRIVSAIRDRDHAALQMVSGIGRKTAERIALELADKLDDLGPADAAGESTGTSGALAGLRALGYSAAQSELAIAEARRELSGKPTDTEELIRVALRNM
jgi:Holliday junction DNA helicase RuvA